MASRSRWLSIVTNDKHLLCFRSHYSLREIGFAVIRDCLLLVVYVNWLDDSHRWQSTVDHLASDIYVSTFNTFWQFAIPTHEWKLRVIQYLSNEIASHACEVPSDDTSIVDEIDCESTDVVRDNRNYIYQLKNASFSITNRKYLPLFRWHYVTNSLNWVEIAVEMVK